MGIDTWFLWRRTIAAYAALSAVFLLASALNWIPTGPMMFAFVVFGPIAWLFWGVPLYVMATIVFALSVVVTLFLQGRSSAPDTARYWLLPALVWFGIGAWALIVNV